MVRRGGVYLCVAVALVSLCALVGCERKPTETGADVVTVWAHEGRERENAALRRIVKAFNDAHRAEKLSIAIDFFPDRQYADQVSIASASRDLPSVVEIDGPYVGPWSAEGLLRPIDEYVSAEMRKDFLPTLIEQGTCARKLYALGAFDSALVVYYNRDITEAVGLKPPERTADAWTWKQFVEALEKVKDKVAVPLSLHMDEQSDEWFTYAFSPLIWSNGGELIDVGHGRVEGVLNSPRAVEAISHWQELFTRGLAEPTTTNPNPFAAGLAAFDWTGHWMLPSFEAAKNLHFGVMPLPRMGDKVVTGSGSWCWGISRDCADPEAAFKVLSWFVDPEHGIKPIVEANGAVPGRRSAFRFFPEYDKMPRRLFREQLETAGRARPRTAVYLTLTSEFASALRDIALGANVRESLTEAAETVQRDLDRR